MGHGWWVPLFSLEEVIYISGLPKCSALDVRPWKESVQYRGKCSVVRNLVSRSEELYTVQFKLLRSTFTGEMPPRNLKLAWL